MSIPDDFDLDAFEERVAIIRFDGGQSQFAAETAAAKDQGLSRWQAMEGVRHAERIRNSGCGRHPVAAMAGRPCPDDLSAVQPGAEARKPEDAGAEHHPKAGRTGLAVPPLRHERRGAV